MADKRKLLELDIDIDSILSKSVTLKKELDTLREAQKELTKSGETNSETFIKNGASITKLSTDYSMNQKQLSNLVVAGGNFLNTNQKIALSIDKEVSSIKDARENNTELLKIRNSLNLSKESEKKLADDINLKLDKNNTFIKENVSGLEKQKIGIGDYTNGVKQAISESGLFGGQLSGLTSVYNTGLKIISPFAQGIKDSALSMKTSTAATEGMTVAQSGLTIATNIGTGAMRIFALAVAATGIGAIIIVIALLIGYFKTFDPLVDKIEQGLSGLGAVVRYVQQTMVSFAQSITSVKDLMSKLSSFILNPIESLKSLGSEMAKVAEEAANLKKEQQDLADSSQVLEIQNAKTESQIKRLLLQSKDLGKSESERAKLADQALKLSQNNYELNKKQTDAEYENAVKTVAQKTKLSSEEIENLRKNGTEFANQLRSKGDAVQNFGDEEVKIILDAEKKKIDSQNAGLEQQERIQSKRNSLIEKAEAKAQAEAEAAIARRKQNQDKEIQLLNEELELFIATENKKNKNSLEQIDFILQQSKKRIEILDKEFEYGKISKEKYETELLNVTENSANEQRERLINKGKIELDLFIAENKSKIDQDKLFTQAIIDEEDARLKKILDKKIIILEEEKKTNQELINLKIQNNQELNNSDLEFLTEKLNLENELKSQNTENQKALENQNKEERLAQLQADYEISLANAQSQLDANLIQIQQGYDAELLALDEKLKKELITQDQYDKKKVIANNKMTELRNQASLKETSANLQGLSAIGGGLESLFGKNKELSTAMALINGAQAITSILAQYPKFDGGFAMAAAIAGAGLVTAANVAKIQSTKFSLGGELVGDSHANGGIPFSVNGKSGFEAEGGEGIINKNSMNMFKPLLSAINVAGGGVSFADGGIIYPNVSNTFTSNQSGPLIDYNLLSDLIGQKVSFANSNLPAPIVYTAISDINAGQDNFANVVNNANF